MSSPSDSRPRSGREKKRFGAPLSGTQVHTDAGMPQFQPVVTPSTAPLESPQVIAPKVVFPGEDDSAPGDRDDAGTGEVTEIRCPVCLDPFSKPVTLPCNHNVCHQHVLDMAFPCEEHKGPVGEKPFQIRCPKCRECCRFENAQSVHINYEMQAIVDIVVKLTHKRPLSGGPEQSPSPTSAAEKRKVSPRSSNVAAAAASPHEGKRPESEGKPRSSSKPKVRIRMPSPEDKEPAANREDATDLRQKQLRELERDLQRRRQEEKEERERQHRAALEEFKRQRAKELQERQEALERQRQQLSPSAPEEAVSNEYHSDDGEEAVEYRGEEGDEQWEQWQQEYLRRKQRREEERERRRLEREEEVKKGVSSWLHNTPAKKHSNPQEVLAEKAKLEMYLKAISSPSPKNFRPGSSPRYQDDVRSPSGKFQLSREEMARIAEQQMLEYQRNHPPPATQNEPMTPTPRAGVAEEQDEEEETEPDFEVERRLLEVERLVQRERDDELSRAEMAELAEHRAREMLAKFQNKGKRRPAKPTYTPKLNRLQRI